MRLRNLIIFATFVFSANTVLAASFDVGTTVRSGRAIDEPYRGPSPYFITAGQMGSSAVGFAYADRNRSESVDVREFQTFQMREHGISSASTAYQFKKLDRDGDALLSRDEFPSVER